MTDQPTAPQTWHTLPDDPADISFPIVVGWDARKDKRAARVHEAYDAVEVNNYLSAYRSDPDWWMPWPTFAPDPMTINQWHDMALLPDGHDELVWIEYEDGHTERERETYRKNDVKFGRKRWRSEAAMLAHVGGTTEAEARGEG